MKHLELPISKRLLMMRTFSAIALGLTSCVGRPSQRDWRDANIHKIIVICPGADAQTNRRAETDITPKLRRQGFDAISASEFFSPTQKYSPQALLSQAQKAGLDGIMEAACSAQPITLKYHPIKNRSLKLSDHPESLDAAISELLERD